MLANEILQGRLPRGLQRFFGIQGDAPTPQLAMEVMPSFDITGGMLPAELQYLFDVKKCSRFFDVTGDATHPGQVQLYNPTGSGILTILERIQFNDALTDSTNIAYRDMNSATLLTTSVTGGVNDSRWFPRVPTSQLRTAVDQNDAGIILGYLDPAGGTVIQLDYVLAPSVFVTFATGGNALRLAGTIWWRERVLPELERAIA